MRRLLPRIVLCAAAAAVLPGCVVSLFSDHDAFLGDERLDGLERRMDAIEQRLPPDVAVSLTTY